MVEIVSDDSPKTSGIGIYSSNGLIAIRIIYFGENFSLQEVHGMVFTAIKKRLPLLEYTDSLRWIHGENDGFPGITIDMHGNSLIVMVYSDSLSVYSRYVSRVLNYYLEKKFSVKAKNILLKIPRRIGKENLPHSKENLKLLKGTLQNNTLLHYRNLEYNINLQSQKGGTYDDLRNLRDFIITNQKLFQGKKVLNLFSNNGLTSVVIERTGAKSIYSLEDSETSIQTHLKNLTDSTRKKHIVKKLDLFKNLSKYLEELNEFFDVILIDPPSLTSNAKDVTKAKLIYSRFIEDSLPFLSEKGTLILCSCSNRIHKNEFERICKDSLSKSKKKYKKPIRLRNEADHPVLYSFPEGDYLKVHIYTEVTSILK